MTGERGDGEDQPPLLGLAFDAQLQRVQRARMHHDSIPREVEVVADRAASFADLADERAEMRRVSRDALERLKLSDQRPPRPLRDTVVEPALPSAADTPLLPALRSVAPEADRPEPDATSRVLGSIARLARWLAP